MYKHSAGKQECASETITSMSCSSRLSKFEKFHGLIFLNLTLSRTNYGEQFLLFAARLWLMLSFAQKSSHLFFQGLGELFLWCPLLTLWIVFLGRRDHRSYKHNASFQLLYPMQWRTCFIFQISRINMNRTKCIVWTGVPDSYALPKFYDGKIYPEFLCLNFSYLMLHIKIENSTW